MQKRFLLFFTLFISYSVFAQLKLPAIFGNNMVFQQGKETNVWGWGTPQKNVSISFLHKKYVTKVNSKGEWKIKLSAAKSWEGGNMIITSNTEKIVIANILIGEVWICSGQSNMEMTVQSFRDVYADEMKTAHNNNIRFVVVKRTFDNNEKKEVTLDRRWSAIDSSTVGDCSATAYFYAKNLQKKLKVPVGLIVTAWGGTFGQSWMDTIALRDFPNYKNIYEKTILPLDFLRLEQLQKEKETAFKNKIAEEAYNFKSSVQINYDDQLWENSELPGNWEQKGYPDFDGIAAYRIEFTVPAANENQEADLHLPAVDDIDSTYINGVFIGSHNVWNQLRVYKVPAGILKAGKNVLAIWVEDDRGGGGLNYDEENFYLQIAGERIPLKGKAKFKLLVPLYISSPGINYSAIQNSPGVLFNTMIAPLLNYTFRGVIWYQGESNAARYEEYRSLFPSLINCWRRRWQQGNFPFLFVQLASYNPASKEPAISDWAFLREAQTSTLKLPNTGMAVTTDIGDRYDIHPKQKKEVGERLAANAFNIVYGFKNELPAGPLLKEAVVKNNSIVLSFKNIGKGLMIKGNDLLGFTIAGADKKFVEAKAIIKTNKVVVFNEILAKPMYVRYAWANAPLEANLFNKDGFPASSFRTDK